MRPHCIQRVVVVLVVTVMSGCGGGLLLRVHSVEGEPGGRSGRIQSNDQPRLTPVRSVRFFFYPYASDSVIHAVPEREFLTDDSGWAEYLEGASPFGSKMGALIAMKPGFFVDTLFFQYQPDDTLTVLFNMRRR